MRILFLCTGNSCRSQMAEGWTRHLKGNRIEVFSAGFSPKGVNPDAIRVMAEVGVDISHHRSKNLDEFREVKFDYVITLCDKAHESCPIFPGNVKVVHVGFDDPPRLTTEGASETERLAPFRRVRDEIKAFIKNLPERFE